jgi:hypothetical protein
MNPLMIVVAQNDPTQGVAEVLSFPIETILAGALLFIGVTGIVFAWAFFRMSSNLTKSNEMRNDIERELISVLRSTHSAINESITAAKQSTMASETTNQSVTRMNTDVHEYMDVQRRIVVPALKTLYQKVDSLDKRFARIDQQQIHDELRSIHTIITDIAKSIVRAQAKANIGED